MNLLVRRRFAASRERMFRAFTEPDLLETWFSPSSEIATEVREYSLRPGGPYRLIFGFPDGTKSVVAGRFEEVRRPERLAFSWTWEPPDPHAGVATRVIVELHEMGEETEIVVTHERLPDEETRKRHDEGWAATLERLSEWIGSRSAVETDGGSEG